MGSGATDVPGSMKNGPPGRSSALPFLAVSNNGTTGPGYTRPVPVTDPTSAQQARRDASTTHTLQMMQLLELYLIQQNTFRAAQAQESAAAAAQRHADAHLNYLWSQYQQSEAGKAFSRWATLADQASRLRDLYTQLWTAAWQSAINDLHGPPPAWGRSKIPASRLWIATVAAWLVAWVSMVLWEVAGGSADEVQSTFVQNASQLLLGLGVLAGGGLFLAAVVRQVQLRQEVRKRDLAGARGVLEQRRQQRIAAFGDEVCTETVSPSTMVVEQRLTLMWTGEPYYRSHAATRFAEQAFTTYPIEASLPWGLTQIEKPRSPQPSYPKHVNDVLFCIAGGEVAVAAPQAEAALNRLFPNTTNGI